MSKLLTYLDIIKACRDSEASLLTQTLHFVQNISIKIHEAYEKHHVHRICELNLLDFNGLSEPQTSQIIQQLLSYEHRGDYPIWRSFLETFYPEEKAIISSVIHPLITAEKEHLDVCIQEKGKYAFIIENKLKGAVFQRNQLGRYIQLMRAKNYNLEQIYVIIIPGWIDPNFTNHIRKSAWKAPKDWRKPNNERACCDFHSPDPYACKCDDIHWKGALYCEKCSDYRKEMKNLSKHVKVIDRNFVNWLLAVSTSDIIPQEEYLLRSAMMQFAHYIKGLYNIRLNQTEIMENIKVLEQELSLDPENPEESYNKVSQTIDDLDNLLQSLENMQKILQVRIWQKEIETYFPEARVEADDEGFYILINDISCGIWVESDKNYDPFWEFYYDENKIMPEGAKEMVATLIKEAKVSSKGTLCCCLAWDYTQHGAERIKSFMNAAITHGYDYQRKK